MRHDGWPPAELFPQGSVVTMGVFDGFHRGHQELLARAVARGRDSALPVVLVTFDRHPLTVLAPERAPTQLMAVADRATHALSHGADHVVVLPFTRELAALGADDFVRSGLVDRLRCRSLVVGSNFRCGHRGAGDLAFLAESGHRLGFDVEGVDLVQHKATTCSSTAIRRALADGDVAVARELLGREDSRILTTTRRTSSTPTTTSPRPKVARRARSCSATR
jgi:riboflavin kinase/FMN adenylyltransferase